MVSIRGTFLHPNDRGIITSPSKHSFTQAHNDHHRINKDRLIFKKNQRSPSSLSLSERDSVRPNLKSTATQAAIGNQLSADLVIRPPVSTLIYPGIIQYQFPTWASPSTSLSNSENSKHNNFDPEQHMYVERQREIAGLHNLASYGRNHVTFWSKTREEYRGPGPLSIPIGDIMRSGLDDIRSRIFTPDGSYLGEDFGCLFT